MMKRLLSFTFLLSTAGPLFAQSSSKLIAPLLAQPLQTPAVVADQLNHFMLQITFFTPDAAPQ
jgi:hypothetical protein